MPTVLARWCQHVTKTYLISGVLVKQVTHDGTSPFALRPTTPPLHSFQRPFLLRKHRPKLGATAAKAMCGEPPVASCQETWLVRKLIKPTLHARLRKGFLVLDTALRIQRWKHKSSGCAPLGFHPLHPLREFAIAADRWVLGLWVDLVDVGYVQ